MLKFSAPGSISQSLYETYQYLAEQLVSLIGFPVTVKRLRESERTEATSRWLPDGSLALPFPGPKAEPSNIYLILPTPTAEDELCRRLAGRFLPVCKILASQCKKSWDIKAFLIKEEQFLWDNVILSLMYRGNQKYNALDLLSAVREALLFRYEGQSTEVGVIASWNWHELMPRLKAAGCKILDFKRRFDLRDNLRKVKATHLLSDGSNSFFVVSPLGEVSSWVSFPRQRQTHDNLEWELVPRQYRHINSILLGRDLILSATNKNEIFYFTKRCVFKWVQQSWHRVSGPPLSNLLSKHVPMEIGHTIVELSLELASRRVGAMLVITSDPEALLREASKGLAATFSDSTLFKLDELTLETLLRLASIDGCMVINPEGIVINAGVILNVPKEHTSAGEGARTAAASFASTHGIAIKVSHDGPITVYENGHLIRHAA